MCITPMIQQKWGWVFGFCRPEIFLFKCYVFGFVEAILVFPRHVPTKSEPPTPPGQFLEVYKLYMWYIDIDMVYRYEYKCLVQ